MRNVRLTLGSVVAATSLLLATHSAWAQAPEAPGRFDAKVMPGIACDAEFGTHVVDLHRAAHFAQDRYRSYLENTLVPSDSGGKARRVVCPIVRDNTGSSGGIWSAAVSVYKPFDSGFFCALDGYDRFGELLSSVSDSVSLLEDGGDYTLALDPALGDLLVSEKDGFYVLRCTIPPSGRIYSYRWTEHRNN